MRILRTALAPSVASQRFRLPAFGSIAVALAIISGILAMHALSVEGSEAGALVPARATAALTSAAPPESAVASVPTAPPASTSPVSTLPALRECDSAECQPGYSIAVVLCALVLLLTLSLLAFFDRTRRRELVEVVTHPRERVTGPRGTAPFRVLAPVILSVSRT